MTTHLDADLSNTAPAGAPSPDAAHSPNGTMSPDAVFKAYLRRDEFVSGGPVTPQWSPDGSALWLIEGAPENAKIQRIDLNSGAAPPLVDVAEVRAALKQSTGREPPYRGLPFTQFKSTATGLIAFAYDGAHWQFDPNTHKLERARGADPFSSAMGWTSADDPVPKLWSRPNGLATVMDVPEQLSPSKEWFASVRNHNLMLRSTQARDGVEQPLTYDGSSECFWDIEYLRFGVNSGRRIFFRSLSPWSPDSLTLLAYRRDITGVYRLPRLNWLKPFEDVQFFPFQKAGSRLDRIDPVFIDVRSGRQVPVQLPHTEDHYVQLLAWHPWGNEAILIVYTRDFKSLNIFAACRYTGTVRCLLSETADTFIKIQHDTWWAGEHGFRLLPDGSGFLWLSTRGGWNHLYHYDMSGTLIGQLTSGDWRVDEIIHVGTDGFVYFTASIDTRRPYDVHVCRMPLEGGEIEQLTHEPGIHAPVFSPKGQAFIDTHSAVDRPTRSDLLRSDGTRLRVLSEMDITRLKHVGYVPPEEFTVKATDDTTDLWGVMYKPFDFDPTKSYPVIEYIYAGPQTVEAPRFYAITQSMMTTMQIPWALAQLGYIVVCLDARGTPGRSKAFHDAIYGNWTAGLPDHAGAIKQLCARNAWMDIERVGIFGHSWGGYFSTAALIQLPDLYQAAVSYSPGYDPWDANIYEPYLGLPGSNQSTYDAADLTKQAKKVKSGRLMILAGTSDDIVIVSAMKMTWALIQAGIDHEFVVIPQAYHQFVGVEEDYLMLKLKGWFERLVKHRAPA